MRVLDDFAGAGGWSVALRARGIEEFATEIMPDAIATRKAAGFSVLYPDVWEPNRVPFIQGYIASPPCQTFSVAGKGTGAKALHDVLAVIDSGAWHDLATLRSYGGRFGDERTALVLVPLLRAYQLVPEWIALEQVPAVLPVWERIAEELRAWGYSAWTGIVKAERYGVPQTRRRAVLIAKLDGEAREPLATHSEFYSRTPEKLDPGVEHWVSMAAALGWGMTERPYPTVASGTESGGGTDPAALGGSGARRTVNREREEGRWITAREHHYHGEQNATSFRLTAQEAAILQSYPADFPFAGRKTVVFRQIGNAVPPRMANAIIGEAIR